MKNLIASGGERRPAEGGSSSTSPEAWIAVVAMGALVAITGVNVAVRYFTNQSIAWTEEISVYLMVVVALAGSAAAAMRDQHIRVAAVCESGSEAKRLRLALLSSGLSTLLFGALTALMAWLVRDELLLGETSAALGLPRWWYTASLTVLAGALTMRSAVWGLRRIRSSRVQLPAQELP